MQQVRLKLKVVRPTRKWIKLARQFFVLLCIVLALKQLSGGLETHKSYCRGAEYLAAVCVHSTWSNHFKRNVWRQFWLSSEDQDYEQVVYAFVVGLDGLMTEEEVETLQAEAAYFQDILIVDGVEENYSHLAKKTKYCVDYFVEENFEFEFFVKTDDDTIVFLDRLKELMRNTMCMIPRIYFGWQHDPAPVANPNLDKTKHVRTDKYFEWHYPGEMWPAWMQGGLYGFSYELAKEVTELEDPDEYVSEDITASLWMHKLEAIFWTFKKRHLVYARLDEFDILESDELLTIFQSSPIHMSALRQSSKILKQETKEEDTRVVQAQKFMNWDDLARITPPKEVIPNIEWFRSLSFLRVGLIRPEETFYAWPDSFMKTVIQQLQACVSVSPHDISPYNVPVADRTPVKVYLNRLENALEPVNWEEQTDWWTNMKDSYRKKKGSAVLGYQDLDMYPLHILSSVNWVAVDDFYSRVSSGAGLKATFYVMSPSLSREKIERLARTATRRSLFSFLPCYADDDKVNPVWTYVKRRKGIMWMCNEESSLKHVNSHFQAYNSKDMRIFVMDLLRWLGFNQIVIWGRPHGSYAELFTERLATLRTQGIRIGQVVLRRKSFHMPKLMGDVGLERQVHLLLDSMPAGLWDLLDPVDGEVQNTASFFSKVPVITDAVQWDDTSDAQIVDQTMSIAKHRIWTDTHIPYGPVDHFYIWVSRAYQKAAQQSMTVRHLVV
eukprot:Clim_evm15s100 gene=Clim_evmTU15s100